jgi:hypothetical protein
MYNRVIRRRSVKRLGKGWLAGLNSRARELVQTRAGTVHEEAGTTLTYEGDQIVLHQHNVPNDTIYFEFLDNAGGMEVYGHTVYLLALMDERGQVVEDTLWGELDFLSLAADLYVRALPRPKHLSG